ncbi:MAG: hypothetical protein QM756_34605 [Polyangiaceae bacterium]
MIQRLRDEREVRLIAALHRDVTSVTPDARHRLWARLEARELEEPPESAASGKRERVAPARRRWALFLGAAALIWGTALAFVRELPSSSQGHPHAVLAQKETLPPAAQRAQVAVPATSATSAPQVEAPVRPTSQAPARANPREPAARPRASASALPASADGGIVAELALLERARAALRGEQPVEAVAALEVHQAQFPHGGLDKSAKRCS